jgi:hypothetical protein
MIDNILSNRIAAVEFAAKNSTTEWSKLYWYSVLEVLLSKTI